MLLAELNGAGQIDWRRALIDASFAQAPEGGEDTGPNPTDRGKSGSKHHVLTDARGIPLAATVTAANVNEVTQVLTCSTPCRRWAERAAGRDRPGRCKAIGLRLRTGAAVVAVAGDQPVLAKRRRARQRPGRVPLVRGTDDRLAA